MRWLFLIFFISVPFQKLYSADKFKTCDFVIINKMTTTKQVTKLSLFETNLIDSLSIKFYDSFLTKTKGYAALIQVNILPKSELIFSGWLFSKSPSLNTVENAMYDVKLLNCSDS